MAFWIALPSSVIGRRSYASAASAERVRGMSEAIPLSRESTLVANPDDLLCEPNSSASEARPLRRPNEGEAGVRNSRLLLLLVLAAVGAFLAFTSAAEAKRRPVTNALSIRMCVRLDGAVGTQRGTVR